MPKVKIPHPSEIELVLTLSVKSQGLCVEVLNKKSLTHYDLAFIACSLASFYLKKGTMSNFFSAKIQNIPENQIYVHHTIVSQINILAIAVFKGTHAHLKKLYIIKYKNQNSKLYP